MDIVANLFYFLCVLLNLVLLSPDQHLSVSLVSLLHIELGITLPQIEYHMSTNKSQHLNIRNNLRRVLVRIKKVLYAGFEIVDILHFQWGDWVNVNRHQVV